MSAESIEIAWNRSTIHGYLSQAYLVTMILIYKNNSNVEKNCWGKNERILKG